MRRNSKGSSGIMILLFQPPVLAPHAVIDYECYLCSAFCSDVQVQQTGESLPKACASTAPIRFAVTSGRSDWLICGSKRRGGAVFSIMKPAGATHLTRKGEKPSVRMSSAFVSSSVGAQRTQHLPTPSPCIRFPVPLRRGLHLGQARLVEEVPTRESHQCAQTLLRHSLAAV